jgi:hypothetical protein
LFPINWQGEIFEGRSDEVIFRGSIATLYCNGGRSRFLRNGGISKTTANCIFTAMRSYLVMYLRVSLLVTTNLG